MTSSRRTVPMESNGRLVRIDGGTDHDAAVAEFTRINGITRCPTACVAPTQGTTTLADRKALEAYAVARDRLWRAMPGETLRLDFPRLLSTPGTIAKETELKTPVPDASGDFLRSDRCRAIRREHSANSSETFELTITEQAPLVYFSAATRAKQLESETTTKTVNIYLRNPIISSEKVTEDADGRADSAITRHGRPEP